MPKTKPAKSIPAAEKGERYSIDLDAEDNRRFIAYRSQFPCTPSAAAVIRLALREFLDRAERAKS